MQVWGWGSNARGQLSLGDSGAGLGRLFTPTDGVPAEPIDVEVQPTSIVLQHAVSIAAGGDVRYPSAKAPCTAALYVCKESCMQAPCACKEPNRARPGAADVASGAA